MIDPFLRAFFEEELGVGSHNGDDLLPLGETLLGEVDGDIDFTEVVFGVMSVGGEVSGQTLVDEEIEDGSFRLVSIEVTEVSDDFVLHAGVTGRDSEAQLELVLVLDWEDADELFGVSGVEWGWFFGEALVDEFFVLTSSISSKGA